MRIRTIIKAQKARTITARLAFILALFLVLYGAAGYWVTWAGETYDKYVQSRNQTFIVHDPFSRKLFNINIDRVDWITLSGELYPDTKSNGEKVRYISHPGFANLVSDECVEEVVGLLNSFEYTFVRGRLKYEGLSQGIAGLTLYYDTETRKNFYRTSKRLGLAYTPGYLIVDDFVYYGDEEFFAKLCAIGDKYIPRSTNGPVPEY